METIISHEDAARVIDAVREAYGIDWRMQWWFYADFNLAPGYTRVFEEKLNAMIAATFGVPRSDVAKHNLSIDTPVDHKSHVPLGHGGPIAAVDMPYEAHKPPYAILLHEKLVGGQIIKKGFHHAEARAAYEGSVYRGIEVMLTPYTAKVVSGIERPYAMELAVQTPELQQVLEQNGIIKKREPAKTPPQILGKAV